MVVSGRLGIQNTGTGNGKMANRKFAYRVQVCMADAPRDWFEMWLAWSGHSEDDRPQASCKFNIPLTASGRPHKGASPWFKEAEK